MGSGLQEPLLAFPVLGVMRDCVSVCSWRRDDGKDQQAPGKEREAGGRGDGDLFRNHGNDFRSSQEKWGKPQFTQFSEAWETSSDDWVLYTQSRGILGGRVAPVG